MKSVFIPQLKTHIKIIMANDRPTLTLTTRTAVVPARTEEIRIVLTGRTGNGKSGSGNTILNREAFASMCSPGSVTQECEKAKGTAHGRRIAVIDTPGIFDTKHKEFEVVRRLKTCISMASPGPHAFLIVLKLDRFTPEEQRSVELLQQVFGDRAAAYSMVLFTYGDQLGNMPIEEFISKCQELIDLIQECGGRFHVFNNKVRSCGQVVQLLEKIEEMVKQNGGSFYTNEMFQDAERAIQEETKRNRKASAEKRRREEEVLRAWLKGEELQSKLRELEEKYRAQDREKAEKKNKYIFPEVVLAMTEVGLAAGAAVGIVAGPLGVGVGAVLGGIVGATVGLVAPASVVSIKKHCVTQ